MRERPRLVSTRVDAWARRGRASHSPAYPFLAAPRQRDAGWFYLRRRKGAAGAGVLRTAPPPPFWLRHVSETAAGFYMRRLTHGRCGGGGVLRTAPPPPLLGCAASERRRLVSTCVDTRARRGRATHSPDSPFLAAQRQRDGGWFYLRRRKGAAGACFAQPRLPLFGRAPRHERKTAACFYTRRRTGAACASHSPTSPLFSCVASARRRLVLLA